MRPCLDLVGVSCHFGGLTAVDEVTLSVRRGARQALIGPNGAGKTTLFNVISGELAPTNGAIVLNGVDITALRPHQRAVRGISRTFQITRLFLGLTVLENALLACIAVDGRRFSMHQALSARRDLVEKAETLLERFQLLAVRHARARHIPYGDQRRLEVALSLAGRPQLLLLDEPMAGLSTPERTAMRTLLESLDPRLTVLMIEHDIDVAFAFAERVAVLHQGRLLAEGSRDEIAANALVQQSYLGGSQ